MKHADLINLAWHQQPVRTPQQLRVCPACGKDNLVARCGFLEVHNLPKDGKGLFGSLVEGRRYCRCSGQQLPRAQRRKVRKVWTDEERKQRLLQHDLDDHARMRNAEVDAAAHTMRCKWSGSKASLIVVDDPIPARWKARDAALPPPPPRRTKPQLTAALLAIMAAMGGGPRAR